MKRELQVQPPAETSARAFTLVELLASVAMVSLLVLLVGSIMFSTSALIKAAGKKLDADGEARTIFDRMEGDFAAMVKRCDVDYQFNNQASATAEQNGSSTLFFYSEAPGISASATSSANSSVSLIGYRVDAQYQLERLGKGLQWTPNTLTSKDGLPDSMVFLTYASYPVTTASAPISGTLASIFPTVLAAGSTDVNYHVIGDDVFRLDFWFLLKPCQNAAGTYIPGAYTNVPYNAALGHTSLASIGLEDVQGIVVAIAVMDAASRQLLPAGVNWAKVAAALPDPANPPAAWETVVANTTTFSAAAGIPAAAAAQIRIYQRTFNLTTPSAP